MYRRKTRKRKRKELTHREEMIQPTLTSNDGMGWDESEETSKERRERNEDIE